MSELTLSKTETAILTEAAAREDESITLPAHLKPSSATRLLAKLVKHGLVEACAIDGQTSHQLTRLGYLVVGLRSRRAPGREPMAREGSAARFGKRQLVLDLLKRAEGANLAELVAATGWLAHTTRAAICRLRKDGQAITKTSRSDGGSAYLIAPEPKARRDRSRATALAA